MQVQPLGWEDPLKEEMATHCSILAWKVSRMEEPGSLQSHRVTKSWIWLSDWASMHRTQYLFNATFEFIYIFYEKKENHQLDGWS